MSSQKISADNSVQKEKITIATYGDLVTDCTVSATATGIGTFCLALVGVPISLKLLDRFGGITVPVKVCAAIFVATGLSVYAAKKSRLACEEKVESRYEI